MQAQKEYLAEPIVRSDADRIAQKYELLGSLREEQGPQRWRPYVARFPGALREAEMCSESTLRARMQAARSFARWIGQERQSCLNDPGSKPLLLWHDAHLLLLDLQDWRKQKASSQVSLLSFHAWTQSAELASRTRRWPPDPCGLTPSARGRPNTRTALHWLAQRVGLDFAGLMEILVDRGGARLLFDLP